VNKMCAQYKLQNIKPLEIVEKDIPEPVCVMYVSKSKPAAYVSDYVTKEGFFPGIKYQRGPGHEISCVIDAIGKDVVEWKARVQAFLQVLTGTIYSSK